MAPDGNILHPPGIPAHARHGLIQGFLQLVQARLQLFHFLCCCQKFTGSHFWRKNEKEFPLLFCVFLEVVSLYVYVYIYVYVYMNMYTYAYVYLCMWVYVCICEYMCVYVWVYVCICVYRCIGGCIYIYVNTV